jgi:hypothetical protein
MGKVWPAEWSLRRYGIVCVCVVVLVGIAQEDNSASELTWPKVLMFSSIDIQYLADSVDLWREVGTNGFIVNYLIEWWSSEEQVSGIAPELLRLNEKGARVGIDHNFVKVALGYKTLPHWADDAEWKRIIDTFSNISNVLKETGTRGIAIDTEAYQSPIFDSSSKRFNGTPKEQLQRLAYTRGQEIITSLTENYPAIEILLLQEGAYHSFVSGFHEYDLWIHFYDGLASLKNSQGIIVATENTYQVVRKDSLEKLYRDEFDAMALNSRDPQFWRERCSIAIGMWPLGREYWDKSSNYSAQEFQEQFEVAKKLSPKYVWIYDHGAAWYRMQDSEIKKYTANKRWIWEPHYQALPTDPLVSSYYDVVRGTIARER